MVFGDKLSKHKHNGKSTKTNRLAEKNTSWRAGPLTWAIASLTAVKIPILRADCP